MNTKRLLLLSAFCILPSAFVSAQGILPAKGEPPVMGSTSPYVFVGDPVPPTLTVTDPNGKPRTLLSYKAATDVLVLGFYSTRCAKNQEQWGKLKRFYEAYKEWRVAFVGISVGPDETLDELAQAMSKAGLSYSMARDEDLRAARALRLTAVPEIFIIDEWGYLRYRGSLKNATKAINTVIGHEPMNVDPESSDVEGCPVP